MTAILNPSFEVAYSLPTTEYGPGGAGRPQGWSFSIATPGLAFAIAGFTQATTDEYPWETFEYRWDGNEAYAYQFVDESTELENASFFTVYDLPKRAEDFSEGWSDNEYYTFEPSTESAAFNSAPYVQSVEAFEQEWAANEAYSYELTSTDPALFGDSLVAFENFQSSWVSGYISIFTSVNISAALFGTALQEYEDFEQDWSSLVMTTI